MISIGDVKKMNASLADAVKAFSRHVLRRMRAGFTEAEVRKLRKAIRANEVK
jgi:hypothetical protein